MNALEMLSFELRFLQGQKQCALLLLFHKNICGNQSDRESCAYLNNSENLNVTLSTFSVM